MIHVNNDIKPVNKQAYMMLRLAVSLQLSRGERNIPFKGLEPRGLVAKLIKGKL